MRGQFHSVNAVDGNPNHTTSETLEQRNGFNAATAQKLRHFSFSPEACIDAPNTVIVLLMVLDFSFNISSS